MPKFGVSQETIEGRKPMGAGTYEVRLTGFKPKLSSGKDSVNLNPQLEVVNHPKFNNRKLFSSMNSGADFLFTELNHCFGVHNEQNADGSPTPLGQAEAIAGEFTGPDNSPEQWSYVGPLVGKIGKVEVVLGENYKTKEPEDKIKAFYCNVPGCTYKHATNLK